MPLLLPYENPLPRRLGPEFFAALPCSPGVYIMYGLAGSVLYVGKAKNLRARLASYRLARPGSVPRKTLRLIHVVDEIRYETCATEALALLRENELLRLHRPSFNVVNKSPESYFFVGVQELESAGGRSLRFLLTTCPDFGPDWRKESLHGAFKGKHSVREAYQSLLRLLWAAQAHEERFGYPGCLLGRKVPYRYELKLAPEPRSGRESAQLLALLHRFFRGTSDALLGHLTEELLGNPFIQPLFYRGIQEDLERLRAFYGFGPLRNRRLRAEFGLSDPLIPQARIDDLLVLYKERKKRRF